MPRLLSYIEAPDRPGVLAAFARGVAEAGGNIVASVAFVDDSVGRIALVVDYPGEAEVLAESLRRVAERLGARIDVAALGPEASALLARLLESKPEAAAALQPFAGAAGIVDALMRMGREAARRVVSSLPPRMLAEVLYAADGEALETIASWAGPMRVARALRELSPDDAAEVIGRLPEPVARAVSGLLPREYRMRALEALAHPEGSVASVMTVSFPTVRSNDSVSDALRELTRPGYELRDVVAVVDAETGAFLGLAEASDLLSSDPGKPVEAVARRPPLTATPSDDAEDLARAMVRYRLRRVPVLSDDGRLLGIVAVEDVARLLAEESAEDLARVAGSSPAVDRYVPAGVWDLFKSRIGWLAAVLVIEAATAAVIKSFEAVIAGSAVLAAFLPLVMASGGGAGTQAVGIVLRSMALGELSERRLEDLALVLLKELRAGAALAAALAAMSLLIALVLGAGLSIAAVVALTVALAVVTADLAGAVLPLLAGRLGLDPASVSTPLVTTLVDVGVSAAYLAIAALLISS